MGRVLFGLLLTCALIISGCGATGSSGGAGTAGGAAPAGAVQVTLREWGVELSATSVKAGRVTFQVKNAGNLEHDFAIEGAKEKIPLLLPGETKELEVELKPGSYSVVCALAGHKEAGMQTKLTVSR